MSKSGKADNDGDDKVLSRHSLKILNKIYSIIIVIL